MEGHIAVVQFRPENDGVIADSDSQERLGLARVLDRYGQLEAVHGHERVVAQKRLLLCVQSPSPDGD